MGSFIEIPKKNIPALPAGMQARFEVAGQSLEIPDNGMVQFPRISSNRRKFSVMESGVDPVVITDASGKAVDHLDVIILCANRGMYRTFYAGAYDSKAKEKDPPICWSPDGVAPHPSAKEPQAKTCASCKQAVYGSKITEQDKKSYACSDSKRLLVLSPDDLEGKIYMVNISYSAHKSLRSYLQYLKQHGVYSLMVETRLSFDEAWDVPVFQFNFIQVLSQEAVDTVAGRLVEPEVQRFIEGETDTESDAPRVVYEEAPAPAPAPAAAPAPAPAPAPQGGKGFGGKKTAAGKSSEETPSPQHDATDLEELLDF